MKPAWQTSRNVVMQATAVALARTVNNNTARMAMTPSWTASDYDVVRHRVFRNTWRRWTDLKLIRQLAPARTDTCPLALAFLSQHSGFVQANAPLLVGMQPVKF